MNSPRMTITTAVLRSVAILALVWLTAFALVQFGQRVFGGWAVSQSGEMIACALGVFLAFRWRVKLIAYVLAGQLAFSVSELVLHSIYGIRAVQGGPVHFAVMGAGTIGVALGWFLRSRGDAPREELAQVAVERLARAA